MTGAAQCPSCHATWTSPRARFCGSCGAVLAPSAPTARRRRMLRGDRPSARGPVSPHLARIAVGFVLAIVAAAAVAQTSDGRLLQQRRDEVALPTEVPDGPPEQAILPPGSDDLVAPADGDGDDAPQRLAADDLPTCAVSRPGGGIDDVTCAAWGVNLGRDATATGVTSDVRTLYVGGPSARVDAIDRRTGALRWSTEIEVPGRAAPGEPIADSLPVASSGGVAASLDTITGAKRWSVSATLHAGEPVLPGIATSGPWVLVADGTFVRAVGAVTGNVTWTTSTPYGSGSTIATGGTVITAPDALASLHPNTGQERWRIPMPGGIAGQVSLAADRVHALDREGALHAIDPVTGETIWVSEPLLDAAQDAIVHRGDGRVVVTARSLPGTVPAATIAAVDAATGEVLWRQAADDPTIARASVTIGADRMVLADPSGSIAGIDLDTGGLVWGKAIGDEPATVTAIGGGQVAVSGSGALFGLDLADGRIAWRLRRTGGSPQIAAATSQTLHIIDDRGLYAIDRSQLSGSSDAAVRRGAAGSKAPTTR